jgi:hypothetical protein
MDALAERRKTFHWLFAEDKADVAVGNLASPASHRSRRDLPCSTSRRDTSMQSSAHRCNVEEERPRDPAGRTAREAVKLSQRFVSPALPFLVRRRVRTRQRRRFSGIVSTGGPENEPRKEPSNPTQCVRSHRPQ